jgi:HEAT repeat protein
MSEHQALSVASRNRDVDALRDAVASLNQDVSAVPLLTQLLLENWHDSHEDIVFELGLIGDSRAVESIAKAITIPFDHLVQWGNLQEFQRKCAYALARIGTPESRSVLEALSKHSDASLRAYGEEGLRNWPLKYQAR